MFLGKLAGREDACSNAYRSSKEVQLCLRVHINKHNTCQRSMKILEPIVHCKITIFLF